MISSGPHITVSNSLSAIWTHKNQVIFMIGGGGHVRHLAEVAAATPQVIKQMDLIEVS